MAGLQMKSVNQLTRERGLYKGSKAQKFVDSECIRHMDKYIPFKSGYLKNSVIYATVIGSGLIRQIAPYAKANYYGNRGRGIQGTAYGGLRGRNWFERMKAVYRTVIFEGVRKLLGAKRR